MITIKKSTYNDIDEIMIIIEQAKEYFTQKEFFQWNKEYPNKDTIKNDIDKNNSFIVLLDNNIVGTFSLIVGEDMCYKNICGNWISNDLYATIHRLAIHNHYKRKGISHKIIKYCENFCIDNNIKTLRIDTHSLNKPMINFIEKNNFQYCGIIQTRGLSNRVAYEKFVN